MRNRKLAWGWSRILVIALIITSLSIIPASAETVSWSPPIKNEVSWHPSPYYFEKADPVEIIEDDSVKIEPHYSGPYNGLMTYVEVSKHNKTVKEVKRYMIEEWNDSYVKYRPYGEPVHVYRIINASYDKYSSEVRTELSIQFELELTRFGERIVEARNKEDFSFLDDYYVGYEEKTMGDIRTAFKDLGVTPVTMNQGKANKASFNINLGKENRRTNVNLGVELDKISNNYAVAKGKFGSHSVSWSVSSFSNWESVTDTKVGTVIGGGMLRMSPDLDIPYDTGLGAGGALKYVDSSENNYTTDADLSIIDAGAIGDFDNDSSYEIGHSYSAADGDRFATIDDAGNWEVSEQDYVMYMGGAGDIDGDGVIEQVYLNQSKYIVYSNTGGSFPEYGSIGVKANDVGGVGDFDNDGSLDIAYVDMSGDVKYYNNEDGSITSTTLSTDHVGGAGDYTGDGKDEFIGWNDGSTVIYYVNNSGTGWFYADTNTNDVGDIVDIDGDGDEEVVFANENQDIECIDINSESHIFSGVTAYSVGFNVVDYDADAPSSGTWTSTWKNWGDDAAPLNITQAVSTDGDSLSVKVQTSNDGSTISEDTGWISITSIGSVSKDVSSLSKAQYHRVVYSVDDSVIGSYTLYADQTPPESVTSLNESSKGTSWIEWSWTNPSDSDFNHTQIYLDGVYKGIVGGSPGTTSTYNATGLNSYQDYTIMTHTVDENGIVNDTWVNDSAITNKMVTEKYIDFIVTHGSETLSGATITVEKYENGSYSTVGQKQTNANGRATFALTWEDTYLITVDSEYGRDLFTETITKETITLEVGPSSTVYDESPKQYMTLSFTTLFLSPIQNADVTVTGNNETLTGVTDSKGEVAFELTKDARYTVELNKSEDDIYDSWTFYAETDGIQFIVYPWGQDQQWKEHEVTQAEALNISITKSMINETHAYINVSYNDSTTNTNSVNVTVEEKKEFSEWSVINTYNTSSNDFTHNFVINSYSGKSYLIVVSVNHQDYVNSTFEYSTQFKGLLIDLGLPASVYPWLSFGLLMFLGLLFGRTSVNQGAVICCFSGWMFYWFGWLNVVGSSAVVALTLASILAITGVINEWQKQEGVR